MLLKRLGIGVVSLLVGFGLAVIIIQLIGTTLEEFGVYYTFSCRYLWGAPSRSG